MDIGDDLMQAPAPPNAADVRELVEERLAALSGHQGFKETTTVEWRGQLLPIPVITMPVDLLSYNPSTHRVRAQRSLDATRDLDLGSDPFGMAGQAYLHHLLMGDPTDPSKVDGDFQALEADLREHGQSDPGIITRSGVLVNGNTRRAALKQLGQANMRVGVLPPDAGHEDLQVIELSLQLRKDHKRDYSFMNFLLAIDERLKAGRPAAEIQSDFRIQAGTLERSRWILDFVREAIQRSKVDVGGGQPAALRLVDFETHQGKLEELYRSYTALKGKSPDEAEALREQRLLAIALGKSKTDLRLIEPDFADRYMKGYVPTPPSGASHAEGVRIPGTKITAAGPSQRVQALRALTTSVLQARAVEMAKGATPAAATAATASLRDIDTALDKALEQAGKQGRVIKRRFAPADRLTDANDDLDLCVLAVAQARATNNFDAGDLDEQLVTLKNTLIKLAQQVCRDSSTQSEGVAWLRDVARLPGPLS
jgi:hypothetical protein